MRNIIVILLAIIFYCTAAHAQEKKYVYTDSSLIKTEDGTDVYDSVTVTPPLQEITEQQKKDNVVEIDTTLTYTYLPVSGDSVTEWKNNRSFAYVKYLDSLLKAEQEKKLKEQEKAISTTSSGGNWLERFLSSQGLQFFLWILAGFFILFVLYKLFLTDGVFRRINKSSNVTAPEDVTPMNGKESDFDALIRGAIQNGNYRLAIRYHYLQILHLLAGKNLVQLAADKTNYQYVREITNKNYQNDFAGLTLNYEYVWYGEFDIDESVYTKLKDAFSSFKNQL